MEPFASSRLVVLGGQHKPPRGFTLVEMVVVLGIIIIITAVVINGQSTYNQSLVLTDTAYTVALSLRQAQSLGLASRGVTSGGGVVSNAGYGVHFAGQTGYTVFADTDDTLPAPGSAWCPLGTTGAPDAKPGNCRYDTADGLVQNYTFSRGFTIQNICAKTTGALSCGLAGLDVVFMRPETRAVLTGSTGTSYTCAEVHVRAPTGNATRIVRISQLGEISVGQTCP